MSTPPTIKPDWATDATVSSGPEATKPVRVDPSDGVRAQGFKAITAIAARTLNGILGAHADWIKYLQSNAVRSMSFGVSPYIDDNSLTGPSPQTVDNVARGVRDSAGGLLTMTCSANAGDRLIVDIGPLFLTPVLIPSATPTVFAAMQIRQGVTVLGTYAARYDAATSPTLQKIPLNLRAKYDVVTTGTISVTLYAWALKLNDSVNIQSPGVASGVPAGTWPVGDDPNQQWGQITVIGKGVIV